MTVSRRSVLLAGVATLGGFAIGGCASDDYRGPGRTLTIGSGEVGGAYRAFAERLADQISQQYVRLHCTAKDTQASVDNLRQLSAGEIDLALTQADAAEVAFAGQPPFQSKMPLRALARIYENYLQWVVRADSPARRVADLAGRKISLGAAGSGAALLADRIAALAGLRAGSTLRGERMKLADAVAALEQRQIEALVWSGGIPTPLVEQLDNRVGITLLPLDDLLPRLRATYSQVYEQVTVPPKGYRLTNEVRTVGIPNLVVCREELPDDVAAAVTRVLVERADHLVPQEALGTQFLDVRTLIGTGAIPLHPGAAAVYRRLHG